MNKCPYLCLFASTNTVQIPSSERDKTEEKKLLKGMISCQMQVTEHFVGFLFLLHATQGLELSIVHQLRSTDLCVEITDKKV